MFIDCQYDYKIRDDSSKVTDVNENFCRCNDPLSFRFLRYVFL